MRPNGILGLCVAVFGEDNSEDSTDLVRLENVARVLINVPSGMTAEVCHVSHLFYQLIAAVILCGHYPSYDHYPL